MKIISYLHRDKLLMALYAKRELLTFINGREWFDEQINDIWRAYYEHVNMPQKFSVLDIDRRRWEADNKKIP
jgi:hypothetical protein